MRKSVRRIGEKFGEVWWLFTALLMLMFGVGFGLLPWLFQYFPGFVSLVAENFRWLCFGIFLLAVFSIICAGVFKVE